MDVFGNDKKIRGCFTTITFGAHYQGFKLSLPEGGQGNTTTPFIITGISFVEAEKFLLVPCFNNITHTYGFGHDPSRSTLSVNFLSFLINQNGGAQSDCISYMAGTYAKNRLSASKRQASLSCGAGGIINGFIVGLGSGTVSQETNIQSFSLQMIIVEPQCGSAKG